MWNLRKTLVSAFLIGSAFVVVGQFALADHAPFWFSHRANTLHNDALVAQPPGEGEGNVGVAEAASEKKEVAPNTRTLREIRIPAISLKTSIQDLGYTSDGRMGAPTNHYEVGWFKYGPKPGERGNAVIAGHVNTLHSPDGAFKELHLLKEGDRIEITDNGGHTSVFRVTGTKRIPYNADADEVFGGTMSRRLVLVTCAGSWIKERRTYTERLLVFAELVE